MVVYNKEHIGRCQEQKFNQALDYERLNDGVREA